MKQVRFGLLGFGEWAEWHARFIDELPQASLLAIAEQDRQRRKTAKKQFGVRTYPNYQSLLAEEEIDVVDVVLPNYLHHEAAITALEAGKNVFLEKPMAVTVGHCNEVIAALRGAQDGTNTPFLAVGFELRLSPLWGGIKQLIREGKIGQVKAVHFNVFRAMTSSGAGSWRLRPEFVGSWLLDAPIHYFDLMRWYMQGRGEPHLIYASNTYTADEGAAVDNFASVVDFSKGGYGQLGYSMGGYGYSISAKVTGERGAISARWEKPNGKEPASSLEYSHDGSQTVVPITLPVDETIDLRSEISRVVSAVQTGKVALADARDGRQAVVICLMAEESLSRKQAVKFSEGGEAIEQGS